MGRKGRFTGSRWTGKRLQAFADLIRAWSGCRDIRQTLRCVDDWSAADIGPDESVKAAVLLLNFKECFCVANGGVDLTPVPDDPCVRHKCFNLCIIVKRDLLGIKIVKGTAKSFPLFQHRDPCQPSLHPLQDQHLKQFIVIVEGLAPLVVVIINVYLVGACPFAPADLFHKRSLL